MKQYGNPYWQEATDNRDKTVAVMREDTFQRIQQALDKSWLNYCAYSDGSNTMIAVNSSEIDHFKNVTGLDKSLCRLQKSGKEHIPQDKNIIGNTDYKYIPQKSYISEDRETILKMAELTNKANISFSARIYPSGKGVMTVSQADVSQISAIQDAVKAMRKPTIQNSRQALQEIIGNRPYREIRNRQFMISPLTLANFLIMADNLICFYLPNRSLTCKLHSVRNWYLLKKLIFRSRILYRSALAIKIRIGLRKVICLPILSMKILKCHLPLPMQYLAILMKSSIQNVILLT